MAVFTFRQQLALTLLLFTLLVAAMPQSGHDGDVHFWFEWAEYIFEHGLGNIYQHPANNYNPFYHYILWLYGHMMGNGEKIHHYRYFLKAYTLVFDFAGAFWAASLVPERSRRFGLVLLLLFNIGYLYDTLLWAQVDSIYTFFSFGAVVLAARRRPVSSLLLYVLALATKTQAIIFLPPLLLLWGPCWWQRPRRLGAALLASAALAVLILAPFIWWSWESYLPRIIDINLHAAEMYPIVSMNAFNIWELLPVTNPSSLSDALPYAGLTYHLWGLIWFLAASVLALTPLLVAAWQSLRSRGATSPALPLVLLTCASIPLLFTFFNTQMHERYWHPAILFLAAYGFVRRDYLPYILGSVAYFLQLEKVLRHLQLLNYQILIFRPAFIASLFGLLILLVLVKLYRLAPLRVASTGVVLTQLS